MALLPADADGAFKPPPFGTDLPLNEANAESTAGGAQLDRYLG